MSLLPTAYKRCLAKCISTTTGLGISLYAGDLGINEEENKGRSHMAKQIMETAPVTKKSMP